jgi:hypothetical protein
VRIDRAAATAEQQQSVEIVTALRYTTGLDEVLYSVVAKGEGTAEIARARRFVAEIVGSWRNIPVD